jgi:hypothetical protein
MSGSFAHDPPAVRRGMDAHIDTWPFRRLSTALRAKLAPMSRAGRYLGVSEAFDSEWRLGVEHRLGVVVSRAL